MISNFEAFKNYMLDTLYITEITRPEWLQIIDEYWDELDITY